MLPASDRTYFLNDASADGTRVFALSSEYKSAQIKLSLESRSSQIKLSSETKVLRSSWVRNLKILRSSWVRKQKFFKLSSESRSSQIKLSSKSRSSQIKLSSDSRSSQIEQNSLWILPWIVTNYHRNTSRPNQSTTSSVFYICHQSLLYNVMSDMTAQMVN